MALISNKKLLQVRCPHQTTTTAGEIKEGHGFITHHLVKKQGGDKIKAVYGNTDVTR